MCEKLSPTPETLTRLRQIVASVPRGLITIDGYSGAGKTFLAHVLADLYQQARIPVTTIHTDWFATWDDPAAWFDHVYDEILKPLRAGYSAWARPKIWKKNIPHPGPRLLIEQAPVVIFEGFSASRRCHSHTIDYALWVDGGSPEACLQRACERDGPAYHQELTNWKEFEKAWFAVDQTIDRADMIIVNTQEHTRV